MNNLTIRYETFSRYPYVIQNLCMPSVEHWWGQCLVNNILQNLFCTLQKVIQVWNDIRASK